MLLRHTCILLPLLLLLDRLRCLCLCVSHHLKVWRRIRVADLLLDQLLHVEFLRVLADRLLATVGTHRKLCCVEHVIHLILVLQLLHMLL